MLERVVGIGIDGCRGGWLVCLIKQDRLPEFRRIKKISSLQDFLPSNVDVFIDMPFGLSSDGWRQCDFLARAKLKSRRATIFPVPCRQAVYAANFQQACQINQQICGKKFSLQLWNLIPKIRELDEYLRAQPALQKVMFESHPELCFSWLNHGRPVLTSKKKTLGQNERFHLLQSKVPIRKQELVNWRNRLGVSQVQMDDLLDALVLAVCAAQPKVKRVFLPEFPQHDDFGLPMNIVYLR